MAISPFDFINAINLTKENLFTDPQANKDYSPWMVNKGLSYFPDTILHANEMNGNYSIPKEWQFSYYLNTIPKKKRFSKWAKADPRPLLLNSLWIIMDIPSRRQNKQLMFCQNSS